jgi:Protein of unknown function (DUF2786)
MRFRSLSTMMDRGTLGLATKLLAKAQGTPYDAEAAALTERAYRLLAGALNAYDDQTSGNTGRKRERRHLRDRRSMPTSNDASTTTTNSTTKSTTTNSVPTNTATTTYTASARRRVNWFDGPCQNQIDLRV